MLFKEGIIMFFWQKMMSGSPSLPASSFLLKISYMVKARARMMQEWRLLPHLGTITVRAKERKIKLISKKSTRSLFKEESIQE